MMFKLLIIMSVVTSALAVAEYYVECPVSQTCYGMLSAFLEKKISFKKKVRSK